MLIYGIFYNDMESILERYEYLVRMDFDNKKEELQAFRLFFISLVDKLK